MVKFVKKANLPVDCSTVIIGEKYKILEEKLVLLNTSSLFVPNNEDVDMRLSGHADLSVFHAGGERLLLAPYLRDTAFSAGLEQLGARPEYSKLRQGRLYPADAGLNACALGKRLIANTKICDRQIINFFTNVGASILEVRQGYARCSVCVVNENAVITADAAIAERARAAGIDALLISPGHVYLEGYDYGFIGGAAFRLSASKLAFTGRLERHPDGGSILRFLEKHEMTPVFLTAEPLFDIGSAIPITER